MRDSYSGSNGYKCSYRILNIIGKIIHVEQQNSALEAFSFYLPKINAPNGNQQFIEYQNQKITDKHLFILFKNIRPITDVDAPIQPAPISNHQHICIIIIFMNCISIIIFLIAHIITINMQYF